MKLSEMRQLLSERSIQLTKSLGQNFLHDGNQLRRITAAADLKPGDRVIEVGPGLGPLTELLLSQAPVLAIEKDRRLAELLRDRFVGRPGLQVVEADALDYVRHESRDWSEWKLVSNLPYSIASPLLVEFAQMPEPPARITVTLQEEVAERLVAAPGNKTFGVLSLLIQVRYQAIDTFRIPRSCFFPPPDVDSACITLARRDSAPLAAAELATFTRLVKLAFSQRRKMMLKLLKTQWPAELLEQAFLKLELSRQTRAEELSLEHFLSLTRILQNHG